MSSDGKRGYSPEYDEGHRDDARLPGTGETPVKMSAGRYLATRFSTLKPPMDKVENPITVLGLLSSKQWLFFFCAFVGSPNFAMLTYINLTTENRSRGHGTHLTSSPCR